MTSLCIIPARGGSKGIPQKNIINFNGKPLIDHTIEAALSSNLDKVVVSTATVALQEQVILKDIPEIIEGSDLEFSFALAKGRARYLCLSKLDMLLAGSDSLQAMMDLYGEELDNPNIGDISLCEDMVTELSAGNWQGDRDDWKTPISEENWRPLTVDRHQCTGSNCSNFHNCCFYNFSINH